MTVAGDFSVKMSSTILKSFLILLMLKSVMLLDNGLARTPPMGWMSWGYYMCKTDCEENPDKCLNEKLILSVADAFYTEGYQEAGYEYIIIDDCWSERYRDQDRRLIPDHIRFPRGMKFLADYIHNRGLKFGMYTNIASDTCMRYPGSRGHFAIDAQSFADWGVDYIKVDGCFVEESYLDVAYTKLGYYLNKTGRPMVYSCSWPYYKKFINKKTPDIKAAMKTCNLWRNYHDVYASWDSVYFITKYFKEEYENMHQYHGPGHWNDPDMLLFGTNTLTISQSRVQLAVYAMLSAPLLLSCDMKKMKDSERKLLLNLDLIAIAQDPLGVMAKPYTITRELTLWVKRQLPMKGDKYHTYSFAVVNMANTNVYYTLVPKKYGLNSMDSYTVLDIFSRKFIRNITLDDTIEMSIPPQDVILYTLFPL